MSACRIWTFTKIGNPPFALVVGLSADGGGGAAAVATDGGTVANDGGAGIGAVSKIVLYGLALSPLDAELGQVWASAMLGSNVRRIHVVDPDYVCVAERVAGLTDASSARGVEILGCPPGRLNLGWRYTSKAVHDSH
jgi:hypothetical protein